MVTPDLPSAPTLPPIPWPRAWAPPRRSRFPLAAGWVIVALAVAALLNPAALTAAASEPAGVLGRVLGSAVVAGFGAAVILIFAGQRPPVAPPRLINAVTLTRAQRDLPDDWVHFFPERRRGASMVAGFAALALLLLGAATAAAVVIVPDPARDTGTRVTAAVIGTVVGLAGLLFAGAAIRTGIGRMRGGSFGRRAMGLAIGRTAVLVTGVELVAVIPWSAIRRVEADAMRFAPSERTMLGGRRRDDAEIPTIVLHLDPAAISAELRAVTFEAAPGDPVFTLTADSSDVHPWVLWAALSYFSDPARRESLGTTFAQRALSSWAAGVAAADRSRRS